MFCVNVHTKGAQYEGVALTFGTDGGKCIKMRILSINEHKCVLGRMSSLHRVAKYHSPSQKLHNQVGLVLLGLEASCGQYLCFDGGPLW